LEADKVPKNEVPDELVAAIIVAMFYEFRKGVESQTKSA